LRIFKTIIASLRHIDLPLQTRPYSGHASNSVERWTILIQEASKQNSLPFTNGNFNLDPLQLSHMNAVPFLGRVFHPTKPSFPERAQITPQPPRCRVTRCHNAPHSSHEKEMGAQKPTNIHEKTVPLKIHRGRNNSTQNMRGQQYHRGVITARGRGGEGRSGK